MNQVSVQRTRFRLRGHGLDPAPLTWLLFAILTFRFAAVWTEAFLGLPLPVMSRAWFTVAFTAFSLIHAITLLGLRRALLFAAACAVVTWSYEEVGILTGAVYGHYHYSDQLGFKLGEVPALIPLAWFMMVYASWIVASFLLQGISAKAWPAAAMRVVVAALTVTAWDAVMDPGMARAGIWTWEGGGPYFGVPLQNTVGWLITTATVYALVEVSLRQLRPGPMQARTTIYVGLPVFLYAEMAVDRLLLPDLPELRIVAAFSMCVIALLASLRVLSSDAQHPLIDE